MNFRNDIQGLRAIAVIFVFIFHLSSTYLPGGFVGVDMFFVISGYLISKIIRSKILKSNFSIIDFYEGRIKRIVPAYFFLLICVWILFQFLFTNSEISKFRSWHFWTLIFGSNIHFPKVDDYFGAGSTENPLLHSWTLSVEMQFYFILPILLLVIQKIKPLLITIIGMLLLLFLYSTIEIYNGNKSDMYFSLLSRSPEFLLGMLFSLGKLDEYKYIKNNQTIFSILGTIGLFASAIILSENSFFPGVGAILPCLSTAILLVTPESRINKLLSTKFPVFIGEISYSIYLWHWPIMAFIRYYTQKYEFTGYEKIFVIFCTICMTFLSYYLIEKPFRQAKGVKFYLPFAFLLLINIICIGFISPVKNKITPLQKEFGYPSFGINSHGSKFIKVETFGDTSIINSNILLIGDSHALTLKPFLNQIGKNYGFNYRTITNDSYPTIPGIADSLFTDNKKLNVYKKLEKVVSKEIKSAKIIFLMFTKDGARWTPSIKKLSESLNDDQKVVIISDYPYLDKNPSRYHSIIKKDNDVKYFVNYPKIDSNLLEVINLSDKLRYLDISTDNDFFKDVPFYNDSLMYYDATHMNEYAMKKLAEYSGSKLVGEIK